MSYHTTSIREYAKKCKILKTLRSCLFVVSKVVSGAPRRDPPFDELDATKTQHSPYIAVLLAGSLRLPARVSYSSTCPCGKRTSKTFSCRVYQFLFIVRVFHGVSRAVPGWGRFSCPVSEQLFQLHLRPHSAVLRLFRAAKMR